LHNGDDFTSTGAEMSPSEFKTPWHTNSQTCLDTQHIATSRLILVIDDSATVRKIVETCLTREGFEIKSFPDGVEAIRWLTTPEARIPHLIILDIGLPKMDGYEVARCNKTKPQLSGTVIIMLSRRDGMIDKLKSRLAGAQGYITKPFKTQDIISTIEVHIGIPA
jgi:twitching motility two-component system response regulator PilG